MSADRAHQIDGERRLALAASAADFRLIDELCDAPTGEPIDICEFRAFARGVWRAEDRCEPLVVTPADSEGLRHRLIPPALRDRGAWALWCYPFGGFDCVPDTGPRFGELEGTSGPVAYLDVTAEGLRRLIALHELAHLIVDEVNVHLGHGQEWLGVHKRLIANYLGRTTAARWQGLYEHAEALYTV